MPGHPRTRKGPGKGSESANSALGRFGGSRIRAPGPRGASGPRLPAAARQRASASLCPPGCWARPGGDSVLWSLARHVPRARHGLWRRPCRPAWTPCHRGRGAPCAPRRRVPGSPAGRGARSRTTAGRHGFSPGQPRARRARGRAGRAARPLATSFSPLCALSSKLGGVPRPPGSDPPRPPRPGPRAPTCTPCHEVPADPVEFPPPAPQLSSGARRPASPGHPGICAPIQTCASSRGWGSRRPCVAWVILGKAGAPSELPFPCVAARPAKPDAAVPLPSRTQSRVVGMGGRPGPKMFSSPLPAGTRP